MMNRIRNKVAILFIILISVSVVFVAAILFYKYKAIVIKETSVSRLNNMRNAVLNIDTIMRSINNSSASHVIDEVLLDYIQETPAEGSYQFASLSKNILKIIDDIRFSNDAIDSVYIYSIVNDYFFKNQMNQTMTGKELKETQWFEEMENWSINNWSSIKSIDENNQKNIILTIKPFKKANIIGNIGYFSININEKTIRKQLDTIKSDVSRYIYILDRNNTILSHNDSNMIGQKNQRVLKAEQQIENYGYYFEYFQGIKLLTSYVISDYTGWAFIEEVPYDELMGPINEAKKIVLITCVIAIIIAITASYLISNSIFSPVKKLVEYMKRAGKGEIDLFIKEQRKDEFGLLYSSFNIMIGSIKSLIDELYVQKLLKKEIQLKMIQSQLNPHFLYNTLDSIHWAAREKSFDEVCNMTFELSKYFRNTLCEGKDLITIKEAVEVTRSYISLQCMRFEDRFSFDIEVSQDVDNYIVLKYIFQPLVENAIYHGIENMKSGGCIKIIWRKHSNHLIEFVVMDNGKGISKEKLEKIKESINNEEIQEKGNFALKNVNLQIKLFYGQEYGLDISSELDKGTRVSVVIPIMEERT